MSAYESWLRSLVRGKVEEGNASLAALLAHANGADPIQVRCALQTCGLQPDVVRAVLAEPTPVGLLRDQRIDGEMPLPHPLEFEWRFSRGAASLVLGFAGQFDAAKLVLLGASTVALCPGFERWERASIVVDRNEDVLKVVSNRQPSCTTAVLDLRLDTAPFVHADLVIADPPWYPTHMEHFLRSCSTACTPGGHALVCLPGVGTRPGVHEERASLVAEATRLGLSLVRVEEGVVPYSTPHFEQNTLTAQGVGQELPFWRRGDLAIFVRTEEKAQLVPRPSEPVEEWAEARVGRVRVKCRRTRGEYRILANLRPVVKEVIFPSFSRRDPRRASANVWTSGNRAYQADAPETVLSVLRALGNGASPTAEVACEVGRPLTRVEVKAIGLLAGELSAIIDTEVRELDAAQEACRSAGECV